MPNLSRIHDSFRDLIAAAEAAGWDIGDNKNVLNRARAGFSEFVDFHAQHVASVAEAARWGDAGPDDACTDPNGHKFVCTGTAYGGDDESYHGEGRSYCIHCGADGDA